MSLIVNVRVDVTGLDGGVLLQIARTDTSISPDAEDVAEEMAQLRRVVDELLLVVRSDAVARVEEYQKTIAKWGG